MNGLAISLFLLVVLATWGILQERRHQKRLASIPVRVHVNGTRGKSSMTRLIAAGLRAGGMRTIAKTTGTMPRFIYHDGTEVPVARAGKANVIEQVRIVRRASELQAQVLVTECMGVNPELQSLLEDRMIRSTHSVITNARADHLDEMGPTVRDVARNLGRTISRNGSFFTAEREHLDIFKKIASERGTTVRWIEAEEIRSKWVYNFILETGLIELRIKPLHGSSPYVLAGYDLSYVSKHDMLDYGVPNGPVRTYLRDDTKKLDMGVFAGGGLEIAFKNWIPFVEVRYNVGLLDVSRGTGALENYPVIKTRALMVLAGVRFLWRTAARPE